MAQVNFKKAIKFPEVLKKYRHGGGLSFFKLAKKIGTSFARLPPAGAAVGRTDSQINTASITLVPALRQNGKRTIFP